MQCYSDPRTDFFSFFFKGGEGLFCFVFLRHFNVLINKVRNFDAYSRNSFWKNGGSWNSFAKEFLKSNSCRMDTIVPTFVVHYLESGQNTAGTRTFFGWEQLERSYRLFFVIRYFLLAHEE